MGQRYRHNYQETGDIIDPLFFVLDNNEMAGEVNGALDRDNFASSDIAQNEVVARAFTRVDPFTSSTAYVPENLTTSWQGGNGNDAAGLFEQTITCTVDCLLVVETALEWTWGGAAWSNTAFGTGAQLISDTLQLKISVDGVLVAISGFFEDMHLSYATYLVGPYIATAGDHVVRVEVQLGRRAYAGLAYNGTNLNDVTFNTRSLIVTQERR